MQRTSASRILITFTTFSLARLLSISALLVITGSFAPLPVQAQSSGDAFSAQEVYITEEQTIQAQREFLCKRFLENAKEETKNGFHGKAEAYLNESVNIAQDLENTELSLIAYRERGRFYRDLKMPEHARQSFAKAYEIFVHQLKETRRKGKSSSFHPTRWTTRHADLLAEYASLLDSLGQKELSESVRALNMKIDLYLAESRAEEYKPQPPAIHRPGAQLDVDFGPFMADVQRKLKASWIPLQHDVQAGKIDASFKISSDGSISDTYLTKCSPSWTANQAVLKSIETAEHLRPLPDGAPSKVECIFTFHAGEDLSIHRSGFRLPLKP